MEASHFVALFDVTALIALLVVLVLTKWMLDNRNLPPGPWGLPVVGYMPFLGRDAPEVGLHKLCNKYGNIVSFYMGSALFVVLGDYQAIKEGFVKQGDNFLGRPPRMFQMKDVAKGIISAEGPVWKEQRRFAISTLRDFGMGKVSLEPQIMEEIVVVLSALAKNEGRPVDPKKILDMSLANIVATIEFGERFEHTDRRFVRMREIIEESKRLAGPMALSVFFPWTRYIPFIDKLTGRTTLTKCMDEHHNILKEIVLARGSSYVPGSRKDYTDAFLTQRNSVIEKTGNEGTFDHDELVADMGNFLTAGSESSSAVLRCVFVYLMHHPEIQQKVHQEIDNVIGMERSPSTNDRARMPYTEAVLMEAQRCGSVTPLNLVHSNEQEATLLGYRIPKRSYIITNLWAVHNDPNLWNTPEKFMPERFLTANEELQKTEYLIPFGIGKRACPGESLARMELFLYVACLFQRFSFHPPNGKLPPLEFDFGIGRTPKPFEMCAVQRPGYHS